MGEGKKHKEREGGGWGGERENDVRASLGGRGAAPGDDIGLSIDFAGNSVQRSQEYLAHKKQPTSPGPP